MHIAQSGGGAGSAQPSSNRRNFPAFLWVFRDFFLQLPTRRENGKPYTLEEYMMERVLVKSNRRHSAQCAWVSVS